MGTLNLVHLPETQFGSSYYFEFCITVSEKVAKKKLNENYYSCASLFTQLHISIYVCVSDVYVNFKEFYIIGFKK